MKVSREASEVEVNSWLDSKKVSEKKRTDYQDQIDILIEAISDGSLVLDSKTFVFTYSLKFPIEAEKEESGIIELKFKPRVKMDAIRLQMASVKSGDTMGMTFAYVAAITAQPKALIGKLLTDDYAVAGAIMVFFL